MAIQWADDFSRYGTGNPSRSAMLDGLPYASLGAVQGEVTVSPDPNDSGRAFQLGIGDFRIALPTVVTGTVGLPQRLWFANLPVSAAARCRFTGFARVDGSYIAFARLEQNGSITIFGRVSGVITEVFNSVNPIVSPGTFNHFEFVHDCLLGEGQLYINGILRASYDGVDAGQTAAFHVCSNSDGGGSLTNMWVKDLVVWDSTGTQNNSVAGTVIVRRLKPNGDSALGGWVPSTGLTGFNLLAKNAPNDATFLSADDTPPAPMAFTLEDLPADVTSVRGLIMCVRARKVDGGDGNLQTGLSPNNVDWDNGADRPMTSAFSYHFDVSELDPDTGAPWNPLDVNDALIRANRTV